MSIDESVNEALEGGAPAWKAEKVGDDVALRIGGARMTNQTELGTGKVKMWDDGSPMKQLVLSGISEPSGEEIRVFAKSNMYKAVRDAIRASNAKLAVGGLMKIRMVGSEPSKTPGYSPTKLFEAKYEPPVGIDVEASDW